MYILKSLKDGSYYIGHTKNLKQRLSKHNNAYSLSTKLKIPWKIVYAKEFNNRSAAIKYEKILKKEKSKKFLERLISRGMAQFGLARLNGVQEVESSNLSPPTNLSFQQI